MKKMDGTKYAQKKTSLDKLKETYKEILFDFEQLKEIIRDHANHVLPIMDELQRFVNEENGAPGFDERDPSFPNMKQVKPNLLALIDFWDNYIALRESAKSIKVAIDRMQVLEDSNETSELTEES